MLAVFDDDPTAHERRQVALPLADEATPIVWEVVHEVGIPRFELIVVDDVQVGDPTYLDRTAALQTQHISRLLRDSMDCFRQRVHPLAPGQFTQQESR